MIPAVGYAHLPLPSVDNGVMPELVWIPALPQRTGPAADWEVPVPRWRLAQEGPFLEERSAESIRSLGPGCAFRKTTYRVSDYAELAGDYGLLNHPRVDRSPTVRRTTRAQWKTVGRQTFQRSGCHGSGPSTARCGTNAN